MATRVSDTEDINHMADKMKRSAVIKGVQFYLPPSVLSNAELAALFPMWTADRISAKTGIENRHIAAPDQCASDLAAEAARRLFTDAGLLPSRVDYVILCTQSPDYFLPTTACLLQSKLGLRKNCGAFDVNLGCSGYVYGLGIAKGLIETGQAGEILLITADTYSKFINPRDKSVRTIFGDAAAATWVGVAPEETRESIGPFLFGTDGTGAAELIVPNGGMRNAREANPKVTTDANGNERSCNDLYMNGPAVFEFTLREVPPMFAALLARAGLGLDALRLVVPHQANLFMLEQLRVKMKIPPEKYLVTMKHCGNTVSSSIPIALHTAAAEGLVRKGDMLALLGFGVGLSWGGCLVRWHGSPG